MSQTSSPQSEVFEVDRTVFRDTLSVQKFRLSNGLKIIVMEDHSAPVFAYHTWLNVGSRNEREGITGIAHLFEHLMFKETKNMKEGEFDRTLEEQGGRVNAATYVDWTFYRESLPKEAFPLIPPLEADRLQNMILSDAQVNSERGVVANEREFRTDNSPSGTMYELLYKTAYTKHPYHWPVIGWMKDIMSISTKDCIEFHRTYYAPNNATVVVVGDVEADQVVRAINGAYGSIPPSQIPVDSLPVEPPQTEERSVTIEKPIPAEKLLIGYHVPNSRHPDYYALEVAQSVLFNGKSSRLYRRLVADTQIATSAGGWVNQVKDPGLHVIDISMQPERKASEAEKVIGEELAKLAKEKVTDGELEKAKTRMETTFWQSFRTADQKAEGLGFHETVSGDYRQLFREVENYRAVTAADVLRVAQTYYRPSNRTVITAKPQKSPENGGEKR